MLHTTYTIVFYRIYKLNDKIQTQEIEYFSITNHYLLKVNISTSDLLHHVTRAHTHHMKILLTAFAISRFKSHLNNRWISLPVYVKLIRLILHFSFFVYHRLDLLNPNPKTQHIESSAFPWMIILHTFIFLLRSCMY